MPRFEPIVDLVESLCLRSGDILMRNKGLYLSCANDVWEDLNETTLKIADRVKVPIRKSFLVDKKTNSVTIPGNFLRICSVNVEWEGMFFPVYRNDKIHEDIVDLGGSSSGACEHNCSHKLCNTIKGYEAIQSVKSDFLPNGSPVSFNCVDRKYIDPSGFFYSETQAPLRRYVSGIWVDTILNTEQEKLCAVELDENGCVCDTDKNIEAVCNSCSKHGGELIPIGGTAVCPPGKDINTWIYYCNTKLDWFGLQCGDFPKGFPKGCNNIYNISELGNQLIFPHNFGFDRVMIRFYSDIDLKDLVIPYMAKETFMKGLQYFSVTNHDKKQQLANIYKTDYSRLKWGLFMELNKRRIADLRMILTPPMFVPSFIANPRWGGDLY